MTWTVLFVNDFAEDFEGFPPEVQVELIAMVAHLERFGSQASRPQVDTLKGSKHANMKEFRFTAADGVWRVAFAFDPQRQGIVLVADDKSGVGQKTFYKGLIRRADQRFDEYLKTLKPAKGAGKSK